MIISPDELRGSPFTRIGKQWMLITAAKEDGSFNTMTASWGGLGVLWGQNVAICVVRPQRYTYEFMESAARYTLSFLPEEYRPALNLLGTKSGRDMDKTAASGLTPKRLDSGVWTFGEAELVLECEKRYTDFIKPEGFVSDAETKRWYPANDFHKMYIGEILRAEQT